MAQTNTNSRTVQGRWYCLLEEETELVGGALGARCCGGELGWRRRERRIVGAWRVCRLVGGRRRVKEKGIRDGIGKDGGHEIGIGGKKSGGWW